jgi:hypothetical protein
MDVSQELQRLQQLTEEYDALLRPLRREDIALRHSLKREILGIEREIGLSQGMEVAMPSDWPANWTFSAYSFPVMLCNGLVTMLVYDCLTDTSNTGSEKPASVEEHNRRANLVALVTFVNCASSGLGTPNDEVIEGHPLYGRGIAVGGAYLVSNSRWIEELRRVNSVHSQFDPGHWDKLNHYLLFFKDRTFECVAGTVVAERYEAQVADVLAIATERLLNPPRRSSPKDI